jgi:hypothetical protein
LVEELSLCVQALGEVFEVVAWGRVSSVAASKLSE